MRNKIFHSDGTNNERLSLILIIRISLWLVELVASHPSRLEAVIAVPSKGSPLSLVLFITAFLDNL